MSKVIIINGPSCAGKTTIAKEICRQSEDKFVHLQIDESKKYLFTILDAKTTPRNIGRPICDNILLQTALIFLQNGYGVLIDTIFDGNDALQIAKYHLNFFKDQISLFVGIDCSTKERLKRFQNNNNNPVRNEATIIAQSNVFESCKEFYNIWFDSSLLNGEEIAESILQHSKNAQQVTVPQFAVRMSQLSDTLAMVSLSRAKRLAYEKAQATFWHYAEEEGDNTQRQWFKELLEDENHVMFTAAMNCHPRENGDPALDSRLRGNDKGRSGNDKKGCGNDREKSGGDIVGFIIGRLMPAPEVYNPGGLTLMIDDFCVQSENLWESVGHELIEEAKAADKARGATQIVVVCGAHDLPKRKFLREQNLSIASEWYVGGIDNVCTL
ncbi:MAG: AAA family ATPase [Rickettsiaceae bacterium]|nr:AAA family ATPase [Rickettsiaceae bacterium]